ncbi:MAG: hypothetical protein EDX89_16090 [Acidobacteria bacterium]|nr:MAG: hypothetical protein EDX89_16090 [Acidobacteriota bacterium]MCE7959638.1 hypothetical protein [Acidobacteria bacterium ACB2]
MLGAGLLALLYDPGMATEEVLLRNWTPPSGPVLLGDASGALPFVPVTPCRIVDTRNAVGPYGGPMIPGFGTRSFDIDGGPCTGIPAGVAAFSLNFTVIGSAGAYQNAYLTVWPTGGAQPSVSTLNFDGGQLKANAAIVPAGTGGAVSVFVSAAAHLLIDINGYFSPALNVTRALNVSGSVSGGGVITASNSSGGWDSVGISGTASATYGRVFGLLGSVTGNPDTGGAGVKGEAPDVSNAYGVLGQTVGTWGYPTGSWGVVGSGKTGGVYGTVTPGTGQNSRRGVAGTVQVISGTAGNNNAGVYGAVEGSGAWVGEYGSGVVGQVGNLTVGYPNGWGVVGGGYFGGVHGVLDSTRSGKAVYGAVFNKTTSGYGVGGSLGYNDGAAVYGVYSQGNMGGTGAKYFVEPHPTDPEKVIRYVALEGPEAGTYFRGSSRTVAGEAVIEVPESFRIVTAEDGLTVQLTPVGDLATMAVMSQDLQRIVVKSSKDVAFHFQVNGVRRAFRDHQAIAEGREFRPESPKARLPEYLPEESKRRLVENGTYDEDGKVNLRTATRNGWTREWEERSKAGGSPSDTSRH